MRHRYHMMTSNGIFWDFIFNTLLLSVLIFSLLTWLCFLCVLFVCKCDIFFVWFRFLHWYYCKSVWPNLGKINVALLALFVCVCPSRAVSYLCEVCGDDVSSLRCAAAVLADTPWVCGGVGGVGRVGVPPRTHVPTHRRARHVAEHIAALRGEEPQSHHTLALETLKRALLCGDKEYEKRIVLFLICLFRSFAIRCKERDSDEF